MRRHLLGVLLLWSATALAQARDATPSAPLGPSGDAGPVDPYANPSTPPAPQTNTPAPSTPPPPSTNVPASPESPPPSQQPSPAQSPEPPSSQQPSPAQSPEPPSSQQPSPTQSPAAPAPSQQQPPPQAPVPGTTPPDAKPTPPASEQQATPPIDKPAPRPVDQPAPPAEKPAQSTPDSNAPAALLQSRAAIVDVASAPPACRDAGSRVSSRDHNTALSSKVSFAICTASSAMASMSLVDAEASVRDLDHATANAFALLDEVAASTDPRWQIVALHAEGDLLSQMTKRMLGTVPPVGAGAPQSATALHDSRMQLLQPHVDPWVQKAQQAFARVDQLARANPKLANDPLVSNAVADSRRRMTNGVATR